jgi:DNA processing protein
MDRTLRRDLLLALNAERGLSRDAICRLALAVEHWGEGPARVTPERARELHVPIESLQAAVALVPAAPAVAAAIRAHAAARGWSVIVGGDDDYPPALPELSLPPPVLFCRGRLPRRPAISVVGSRAADSYGIEATGWFAGALARAGLTVVSGLARGIDTAAHRAATRDPGSRTVAVLGCGLDLDYPRGSERLRREIERQGAVVTEFPAGTPALPQHFPIRNRIIAALGVACIVIQAAPRSGSLSTARHALELGREVWALPGRIFDRRSAGANLLIRDGASPALDPQEILESLPIAVTDALRARAAASGALGGADAAPGEAADRGSGSRRRSGTAAASTAHTPASPGGPGTVPAMPEVPASPGGCGAAPAMPEALASRLLELLVAGDPTTAEVLARRSGRSVDQVLAALLDLEIEGRVGRLPGSRFVKRASPWSRL